MIGMQTVLRHIDASSSEQCPGACQGEKHPRSSHHRSRQTTQRRRFPSSFQPLPLTHGMDNRNNIVAGHRQVFNRMRAGALVRECAVTHTTSTTSGATLKPLFLDPTKSTCFVVPCLLHSNPNCILRLGVLQINRQ